MKSTAILSAFVCFISVNRTMAQAAHNFSAPSNAVPAANNSGNNYYTSSSNYNPSPVSNRSENVSQSRGEIYRNNYSTNDTRTQGASMTGYSYEPNASVSANSTYSGGAALTGSATRPAPGNSARYSPGVIQYSPYHTSIVTKNRSKQHYCDSARINCPQPPTPGLFCGDAYRLQCLRELLYVQYISDYFVTVNEPATIANNIVLASFDGYVVYDRDTLTGIVTMNPGSVYIVTATGQSHEKAGSARFNYRDLKAITLYKGNKTLYLTRLDDKDAKLWRIIHNGRLKIYDDNNSFLSAGNISREGMRVQLPGEANYVDIASKKHLAWCINRTYGLHLKAASQSWKSLIELMDRLD